MQLTIGVFPIFSLCTLKQTFTGILLIGNNLRNIFSIRLFYLIDLHTESQNVLESEITAV